MLTLYVLLILMLAVALGLTALLTKRYVIMSLLTIVFSFILYQFSGNPFALKRWLTEGKQHYEMRELFEKLGGVDGAITRIEKKLASDPQDVQGWVILGKLYLAKQNFAAASHAFMKAKELQPNNIEIAKLEEIAKSKINK